MSAANAAGEHGAVLGKNIYRPAVNFAEAGDDAIGWQLFFGHAEVRALGFRQHELFDESLGVQELADAFAGGKSPFGPLFCARLGIGVEGLLF